MQELLRDIEEDMRANKQLAADLELRRDKLDKDTFSTHQANEKSKKITAKILEAWEKHQKQELRDVESLLDRQLKELEDKILKQKELTSENVKKLGPT